MAPSITASTAPWAMVGRGFIDSKRVGGGRDNRALAPVEGSDETGR